MLKVPSLRLLTGFEAAARYGSFSQAAKELCLSQSAISHQIQQLEEHLGIALFRRVGRGVELTMTGKLLLSSVTSAMGVLRSGLERMAPYLEPGLVVLVCPAPIAQGWLQPRLELLQQEIPGICPLISTDESVHYIDEMDVDITISAQPLNQKGIVEQRWAEDEWICVVSTALAAQVDFNAQQPAVALLSLEEDLLSTELGPQIKKYFSHCTKTVIYDDARLLLDAVLRGRGLAYVSRLQAEEGLAQQRLVQLTDYPAIPKPALWISRAAGETRSSYIKDMFDWLTQAV